MLLMALLSFSMLWFVRLITYMCISILMLDYENPDVIVWLGIWVLNQHNHQYVSDIAVFGVIIGGYQNVQRKIKRIACCK